MPAEINGQGNHGNIPPYGAKDRQSPVQSLDWKAAMYNTSGMGITHMALSSARGQARFPGAILAGLTMEVAKQASPVQRYALYVMSVSSLYFEHRDGFIDDPTAHSTAQEIFSFFEQALDGRELYTTYFQEELQRTNEQAQMRRQKIPTIPEELEAILQDPKKLLDKFR